MPKYRVAAAGELLEGDCRLVRAGKEDVAVFLVNGVYRAYRNFCPHAGAPLCAIPAVGAANNRAEFESGRVPGSLRCPWHGWEFDLATGAFLHNPRCTLDAYPVEVEAGVVSVWLESPL